ncbi:AtpZ/AtpI family protein [Paenibacillus sp. MBLB4367]|uniref:AtpZ/AtpI family protein n=1 Tax=Paenibacillus sp. MBLB4367 TaxID=3384767 RepID=UPI0039083038
MKKSDSSNQSPWRAAGLLGAIGLDVAACTVLGYFGGRYAESIFGGGKGWVIGGVLVGFFVGIATVVLIIRKFMEDDK